ncbi:hypothetical protein EMMF5_001722 [Cystobasidiomycetes sp. EMM_F5]
MEALVASITGEFELVYHFRHADSPSLLASMRTVGVAQRALDLMITRVTDSSRKTFGKQLSEHGVVIERVAKARMELDQARLLVLVAAIQIDTVRAKGALRDIGIAKVRVGSQYTIYAF